MRLNKQLKGFYYYDGKKQPKRIANNLIDFISKLANDKIDVGYNNQDILDQVKYCLDNNFMKDLKKGTLSYYNILMDPYGSDFQKLNIYKFNLDPNENLF